MLYDPDGTLNPTSTTCTDSYANNDNTGCIPCGHGMQYSSANNRC